MSLEYIILLKTIIDRSFRNCRQGRPFLTSWRPPSWSVTSRERDILALWRHIRLLFLHVQTGAKTIFTSE